MPPENLPAEAKKIYLAAEESAKKTTCKDAGERQDECVARVAWSAVKRKYKKDASGKWIPKADVQEFSMAIVKASYDKATATRRWRAVASDTEEDSYKDSMSLELFSDFMDRIETEEAPPEDFRSDFWSGGKPYLSVSHYPDLNGKGVPGPVDTIYIDGNRLKSTGRFDDTPIGRACFESICKDLYSEDPIPEDQRIRISIAFLDYKHKHKASGYVFERSKENPLCPECLKELLEGESGGKEFLRGHLIHLAMTRVPVNTRTQMEVERSMTTRKEDAASIIGEEQAEELEAESKMVGKSEALVIKADDEEVVEEVSTEEAPAEEIIVEEGKHDKKMMEDEEEEDDEEEKKKKEEKSDFEEIMLGMLTEIKSGMNKPIETHPLDEAIVKLKSVYDIASEMDDSTIALQTMQEPFEFLVRSIQDNLVREEPQQVTEEPVSAESSIAELLADFKESMSQEIGLLRAEVAAVKSAPKAEVEQVPQRRSIPPQLVLQPTEQKSQFPKLRSIVEKSVGL